MLTKSYSHFEMLNMIVNCIIIRNALCKNKAGKVGSKTFPTVNDVNKNIQISAKTTIHELATSGREVTRKLQVLEDPSLPLPQQAFKKDNIKESGNS